MATRSLFWRRAILSVAAMVCLAIVTGFQGDIPRIDIASFFTPSGFMGDGELGRRYIEFSAADSTAPHSAPTCIRVSYSPGPNGWAGIYWQNLPDNWGDRPGTNYSGRGFSKVTFWAKGARGSEVVEFKAGGIDNSNRRYRDSFTATTGRMTLTTEWRQHEIDLRGLNLTSVIGGFCWVVSRDYNPGGPVTFYLDDIYIE
jgi:hypothetical protein